MTFDRIGVVAAGLEFPLSRSFACVCVCKLNAAIPNLAIKNLFQR
jgi:hypothetical protein